MNHYEVLGIHKDASNEEIKEAYKKLIKKYHPDIYKGDKSFAEKRTSAINVAYEVLSNPETRQAYDDEIFPKVDYSYTPPTYTYSDTSDRYRHTNSSFDSNYVRNHKDGSEHDYSTYVNYDKYHSDFQSSHTSKSHFTESHEHFTNTVIENVDRLSHLNKIRIFLLFACIYVFFLVFFIIQLSNIQHKQPVLSNINTSINNMVSDNTIPKYIPPRDHSDIQLNDYFSDQELDALYEELQTSLGYSISREDFETLLKEYIALYLQ